MGRCAFWALGRMVGVKRQSLEGGIGLFGSVTKANAHLAIICGISSHCHPIV